MKYHIVPSSASVTKNYEELPLRRGAFTVQSVWRLLASPALSGLVLPHCTGFSGCVKHFSE